MTQRLVRGQPPERAYTRVALFALELLDGVTLARVSEGVTVVASGVRGKPMVNTSGLFVWLNEDLSSLEKVSIDPGALPFQAREIGRAQLRLPPLPQPLTTIELAPRVDYPFAVGITGLRGTLIESRFDSTPRPVTDAELRLRWLDEDALTWRDAPTRTRTNASGDFAAILRLGPSDVPLLDASGAVTVRLFATRAAVNERSSADVKLPTGRVAEPTTSNALSFAWGDLQP
jgi:hypothetical protein